MTILHTLDALLGRQRVVIWQYEQGLLYRHGRFVQALEPGEYTFWPWQRAHVESVDMREQSFTISGQEMLTSDRIAVRVTLLAQYAVADAPQTRSATTDASARLYEDLQLELRGAVASRDLDTLLSDRHTFGAEIRAGVAEGAARYGLELRRVGLKDIILPGNVRDVMLREIEADRLGRAELVRARHDVAAARARANAAKLMAENPHMLRLKQLETLQQLAYGAGNVIVLPEMAGLLESLIAPKTNGSTEN